MKALNGSGMLPAWSLSMTYCGLRVIVSFRPCQGGILSQQACTSVLAAHELSCSVARPSLLDVREGETVVCLANVCAPKLGTPSSLACSHNHAWVMITEQAYKHPIDIGAWRNIGIYELASEPLC